MMGLSRSKPLRSSGEHDWEPETHADTGGTRYVCSRCGDSTWRAYGDEPEPDEWPCSGLNRGSGLDPVSESNSGGPETFGSLADYARRCGCSVNHHDDHKCEGEIHAHHVRSRGAGHGDCTSDGRGNVVGLCWRAHHELHNDGIKTFERRYSVTLSDVATRISGEYRDG